MPGFWDSVKGGLSWAGIKPFQPGYGDPTRPMQGEAPLEYDIRRGILSVVDQAKPFLTGQAGPGRMGADAASYFTSPLTGPALPPPPKPAAPKQGSKVAAAVTSGPATVRPFSREQFGSMVQWAKNRGATVTSWDRNAGHNKNVGGVGNSYHLTGQAFDSVPPKGFSMAQWQGELKAKYPQFDVINEGDHVHVEPPGQTPHTALGAFQQAASAVGLNQGPPAPNLAGYQNADALLQQVQGNVMRPFGATFQETPLPELPKPDLLQAPDYSAGDAAFAKAAPKNPFGATPEEEAKGKLHIRRADYFAGLGQALGSINWSHGVGLGELFAKLGAGALMGAKAGDDEVRDRQDKFDAAMQQYQLAVANRDDAKATAAANIANQNIQGMNQYKRDLWTTQVKEIEKNNPQVVDGVLITRNKNPDGTTTETHTPLDPARQTAALFARANNQVAAGNMVNEFEYNTYRFNRELAGAALPYALADANGRGDFDSRDGVMAIGLAEGASAVVESGRWEELYGRYIGADRAAMVRSEAYRVAGVPTDDKGNLLPGTQVNQQQQEAINSYLTTQVMTDFVNSKKAALLVGGNVYHPETKRAERRGPDPAVASSVQAQREKSRRVRTSTNAKGQTTTTESY